MRNLFDFSDAQMSWRSCQGFNMDHMTIIDNNNDAACDDEEDWFFPQPSINVPEDITARYKKDPEPALPPIIYFSGLDFNCKEFKLSVNLADFGSWNDFLEAFSHKYIYISIVDADNCDFEKAKDVMDSEEVFNELVDNYLACL